MFTRSSAACRTPTAFGLGSKRGFWPFMLAAALFVASCAEPAETALPKLIKKLRAKDHRERYAAAMELGRYGSQGEPAVEALIDALWDDNMAVRTYAAYSLHKIGTPKAVQAVEHYKKEKERQNKDVKK